jgi:2-keto-3-deoxy-L-rhamnonate aldolase RhmA
MPTDSARCVETLHHPDQNGDKSVRTPTRRIRRKFEAGQPVFGTTVQLPSPDVVEIAGYAGLDFVWIDGEHGTMDLGDINQLVRAADAAGIDAIVRVPDHSASFIQRVLDTGAAGILVPHVRTVADAVAIVAAARFGPIGRRGACPSTRAVGHQTSEWPMVHRQIDADVMVFGLIEEVEGVENVEVIAHESGLDGLAFGPFDLSQSLGLDGDVSHPEIEAMHRRVTSAAKSAGIEYLSIPAWEFGDMATVSEYSRMFAIAGDRGALMLAYRNALANITAELNQRNGVPVI